jgi:hypothetical protein
LIFCSENDKKMNRNFREMSKYLSFILFGLLSSHVESFGSKRDFNPDAFPHHFTDHQMQQLVKQKATTSTNPNANFVVDEQNHKKLWATLPYRFQVMTNFPQSVEKVANSEYRVDSTKLMARYRFVSAYAQRFNSEFEVALEGKTINIKDSVLGEKDFIGTPGQLFSSSSFYYIATADEQFCRETPSIHRLNLNMENWLLIWAQLGGEHLFVKTNEYRKQRGQELFKAYLTEKDYQLNSDGVLTMKEYIICLKDLQNKILAHHGLRVEDVPFQTTEEYVQELFAGQVFCKARVEE